MAYEAKNFYQGDPESDCQFIDPPLSERGEMQCEYASHCVGEIMPNTEVVFVAPFKCAL